MYGRSRRTRRENEYAIEKGSCARYFRGLRRGESGRVCKEQKGKQIMDIMTYVKPELIVVTIVLYFIGIWMRESEALKNKYIPLLLGGIGILLCAIWVLASSPIRDWQEAAMAVFTSIVQGVLVAGLSTYVNQILKQKNKNE